jgi:hypothetical protein
MAASSLGGWTVDADEMRREAAACRLLARIAAAPASAARLLKAADEWDQLAQIADACREKPEADAGAKPENDDVRP